jgi:hypothetical protein
MLPDGLSDVELMQCKLPFDNILGCKTALVRTALACSDENQQLKALVPIREYRHKMEPPKDHIICPLLKHFPQLLQFNDENNRTQSGSSIIARISSNLANIQNILHNGLQLGHQLQKLYWHTYRSSPATRDVMGDLR